MSSDHIYLGNAHLITAQAHLGLSSTQAKASHKPKLHSRHGEECQNISDPAAGW